MNQYELRNALKASALEATIENVDSWWMDYKQCFMSNYSCTVDIIALHELRKWDFGKKSLTHDSGRFFSILPMNFKRKRIDEDKFREWDQPIIVQPEIGYLGFLTFVIDEKLFFLAQGKIEPGNEGFLQISPTIQATKSNFEIVHGGRVPDFTETFMNNDNVVRVLYDQIQSEQGSRFYKKRNRNVILLGNNDLIRGDLKYPKFVLLTLKDLKNLMIIDNVVNMDTRTVLSNLIAVF